MFNFACNQRKENKSLLRCLFSPVILKKENEYNNAHIGNCGRKRTRISKNSHFLRGQFGTCGKMYIPFILYLEFILRI